MFSWPSRSLVDVTSHVCMKNFLKVKSFSDIRVVCSKRFPRVSWPVVGISSFHTGLVLADRA